MTESDLFAFLERNFAGGNVPSPDLLNRTSDVERLPPAAADPLLPMPAPQLTHMGTQQGASPMMTPSQLAMMAARVPRYGMATQVTPPNADMNTRFVSQHDNLAQPIGMGQATQVQAPNLNTRFVQQQQNRPMYNTPSNLNTRFTNKHTNVSKKGLWG